MGTDWSNIPPNRIIDPKDRCDVCGKPMSRFSPIITSSGQPIHFQCDSKRRKKKQWELYVEFVNLKTEIIHFQHLKQEKNITFIIIQNMEKKNELLQKKIKSLEKENSTT